MRASTPSSSARPKATSCSKASGTSWRWSGNCPSISRLVRRKSPTRMRRLGLGEHDLHGVGLDHAGEPGDLAERPRRDDRLADVGRGRLEGRLAHGQPVRVGGHHREALGPEAHQHAGQHRAGLVAGRGPGHALDGRPRRRRRAATARCPRRAGSSGKSPAWRQFRENADPPPETATTPSLSRCSSVDGPVGHAAHDVGRQAGQHHRARLLDRRPRAAPAARAPCPWPPARSCRRRPSAGCGTGSGSCSSPTRPGPRSRAWPPALPWARRGARRDPNDCRGRASPRGRCSTGRPAAVHRRPVPLHERRRRRVRRSSPR